MSEKNMQISLKSENRKDNLKQLPNILYEVIVLSNLIDLSVETVLNEKGNLNESAIKFIKFLEISLLYLLC